MTVQEAKEKIKEIIYFNDGSKAYYIDISDVIDNECSVFIEAIETILQENERLNKIVKYYEDEED